MKPAHLPLRRTALLATVTWLIATPLLAQQAGLPQTRNSAEFDPATALRVHGRPRWQGRMQVSLQVVPACQIDVVAAASPSIHCTRGVMYHATLSSDASSAPWATPTTVLASPVVTGGFVRITEQRLLVEF